MSICRSVWKCNGLFHFENANHIFSPEYPLRPFAYPSLGNTALPDGIFSKSSKLSLILRHHWDIIWTQRAESGHSTSRVAFSLPLARQAPSLWALILGSFFCEKSRKPPSRGAASARFSIHFLMAFWCLAETLESILDRTSSRHLDFLMTCRAIVWEDRNHHPRNPMNVKLYLFFYKTYNNLFMWMKWKLNEWKLKLFLMSCNEVNMYLVKGKLSKSRSRKD